MKPHLAFKNFKPEILVAAATLFSERPWRLEDRSEQQSHGQIFLNEVCESYGVEGVELVITSESAGGTPSDSMYQPAEFEEMGFDDGDSLMVSPPRITLGSWSIITLFHNARVHVLAQGGANPVGRDDPTKWACSLFYTVRPVMFRARVREGRILGMTARDTYTTASWEKLKDAGFAMDDRLTGSPEQWRAVLDDVDGNLVGVALNDASIGAPLDFALTDSLPDELEVDVDEDDGPDIFEQIDGSNRDVLRAMAASLNIPGRGSMNVSALRDAVRAAALAARQ